MDNQGTATSDELIREEKVMRWQFSIRWLLLFTAVVATLTGIYCINPPLSACLTTIAMALWIGVILQKGIFGSMAGGALTGAFLNAIAIVPPGVFFSLLFGIMKLSWRDHAVKSLIPVSEAAHAIQRTQISVPTFRRWNCRRRRSVL